MNKLTILAGCAVLFATSCKKDKDSKFVNEFHANSDKNAPTYTIIANSESRVSVPWDIDFNTVRPNELWVLNKGTEATGGTTVMLSNAGMANQEFDYRKDANSWHFMALPSALAFSENGNWATVADIVDANRQGGSFTGPSLWSSDLNVYAMPSGGNGSHLDMLHGSPYSMGIENDKGNAFWVFDGYHEEIVWYDFVDDHGPGNDDHSDGIVYRYKNVKVKRKEGIPAHMVKDPASDWLYVVDPGNNRIIRVNTANVVEKGNLALINEILAQHKEMEAEYEVFVTGGFVSPCGIELIGNTLFVSDNANGEIIAYDIETKNEVDRLKTGHAGIMGITAGPDGKIWFANASTSEIVRIDPN